MISSIVLAFSLSGLCAADPPLPLSRSVPVIPNMDALRNQELRRVQRGRATMEATIEMIERIIKNHSDLCSPDRLKEMRRDLEYLRKEVEQMKKYERELLSDSKTPIAPMPRKVKRYE